MLQCEFMHCIDTATRAGLGPSAPSQDDVKTPGVSAKSFVTFALTFHWIHQQSEMAAEKFRKSACLKTPRHVVS